VIRTVAAAALLAVAATVSHAATLVKGPYLMQPTTDSVTVCWVSDTESTGGTVRYALGATADPTKGHAIVEQGAPTRYHRVRIGGLKAYTRYAYQVTESGQAATPATFVTAALPRQPFHFIAYGDCRTQPAVHASVLARMATFHPDFVIQTGDLVADGTNEAQWDVFWKTATPLMRETPYYPALGNHEKEGAPYFRYFGVPAEYSFDYGNIHFVALDSNRPETEFAAQEKFLRDDLLAHQNAIWRIVFFHHTVYTCVDKPDRRELAKALSARLEPIFKAGHVQMVINGHDHDYQRHVGPTGITYLVTGGGGAPLYTVTPDTPYVKVAKMTYNDCEITVDGTTINVRAVAPDGTEIDKFTLTTGK
jgi:hypothetical protein